MKSNKEMNNNSKAYNNYFTKKTLTISQRKAKQKQSKKNKQDYFRETNNLKIKLVNSVNVFYNYF